MKNKTKKPLRHDLKDQKNISKALYNELSKYVPSMYIDKLISEVKKRGDYRGVSISGSFNKPDISPKEKINKANKKKSFEFETPKANRYSTTPQCLEIINYLSKKRKHLLSKPKSHIRVLQTLMSQMDMSPTEKRDLLLDVIDFKSEEWSNTPQEKYLRPATLFKPENFWKYVDEMNEEESSSPQVGDIYEGDDWE